MIISSKVKIHNRDDTVRRQAARVPLVPLTMLEEDDDDGDWEDWAELEEVPTRCLFTERMFSSVAECLTHMASDYQLDLLSVAGR